MKISLSLFVLFSVFGMASAKPGGTYVLTGKETSVFGIFQADMKAFPAMYEGEDVNEYYKGFKAINDLEGDRKLKIGEEIIFPHTTKSRVLHDAEVAEAARRAAKKEAERIAKEQAAAANEQASSEEVADSDESSMLFGYDSRSRVDPEQSRRNVRRRSIHTFHQTLLPHWVARQHIASIRDAKIDELIQLASDRVDQQFAAALKLRCYPKDNIYIFEFEEPESTGASFFFAVKNTQGGVPEYYALQKGLQFFGAGKESVLFKWQAGMNFTEVGDRNYTSLADFLEDLGGHPVRPDNS